MSTRWETVRIFISSTFRDMQAERDWLVRRVFPELRQRLEPYRINVLDIDLRWGITRAQEQDGRVLELCLAQIDTCRPFFLGLLGDRYGHVPSGIPQEVTNTFGFTDQHVGKSVTELEFIYGVLNDPDRDGHALFCFRSDQFSERISNDSQRSLYIEGPTEDEVQKVGIEQATVNARARQENLLKLKAGIRTLKPPVPLFDGYPAYWSGSLGEEPATSGRTTGLEAFGNWVFDKLEVAILGSPFLRKHIVTANQEARDPLAEERDFQERFIESRCRIYVKRQMPYDQLSEFAASDSKRFCLVTGQSGCGKSAALAHYTDAVLSRNGPEVVIPCFIGASSSSTNLPGVLRYLCRHLKSSFGLPGEIALDLPALSRQLRDYINLIPLDKQVLMIIDGLDQLSDKEVANSLFWLPEDIPLNFRLIVTCNLDPQPTSSLFLGSIQRRNPHEILVGDLTDEERLQIIREFPSLVAKTLDDDQVALLLRNESTRNPLFLLVALEELRGFGSFDALNERIESLPEGDNALIALLCQVITRLEIDFAPVVVREVLTLIACARMGLSEQELLHLVEGRAATIDKSSSDLFPILRQLRPYLQQLGPLFNYSQACLLRAITLHYWRDNKALIRSTHARLADYFQEEEIQSTRRIEELPWHLCEAAEWERLYAFLSDWSSFQLLWKSSEYDAKYYWTQIEANSSLRMIAAYDVAELEGTQRGVAWELARLFRDCGHVNQAIDIFLKSATLFREVDDRVNLAIALANLAASYFLVGAFDEALEALDEQEEALSPLNSRHAPLSPTRALILQGQGGLDEAISILEQNELRFQEEGDLARYQMCLGNRALLIARNGDLVEAEKLLKKKAQIALELGDQRAYANSLAGQAIIHEGLGNQDEALRLIELQQGISRRVGDLQGLSVSLGNQAFILRSRGEIDAALSLHKQEEEICRTIHDKVGLASSLYNQGSIYHQTGRVDLALPLYVASGELSLELSDLESLVSVWSHQASILRDQGRLEDSLRLQREIEGVCLKLGDSKGLADCLSSQSLTYFDQGEIGKALELHKKVMGFVDGMDDRATLARIVGNQGLLLQRAGRLDEALELFQREEQLYRVLGQEDDLQRSLGKQGTIYSERQDFSAALARFAEAESICRRTGNKADLLRSVGNQAMIYGFNRDFDRAVRLHEEEEALCLELNELDGLARSKVNQGLLMMRGGRRREGLAMAEQAYTLAVANGSTALASQIRLLFGQD